MLSKQGVESLATFVVDGPEELVTRNRESRSLVYMAMDNTRTERELREALEGLLANRQQCLRYLKSDL